MGRRHKRSGLGVMLLTDKDNINTRTPTSVLEGSNAIAREKDRYVFSSVYPNEAVMNRVETILRDNRKKLLTIGK